MARMNLERMSYSQLATLRVQVDKTMTEKQVAERTALRQQMTDLARQHGLSLDEVLGRRKGKGSVAVKNTGTPRILRTPGPAAGGCRVG